MRTRLRRTSAKLQICLVGRVLKSAANGVLWVGDVLKYYKKEDLSK